MQRPLVLEPQRHVHHGARAGRAGGRGHLERVRREHLGPDGHGAEEDLQAVEEVLADDDHVGAAVDVALAGGDGLDLGTHLGVERAH